MPQDAHPSEKDDSKGSHVIDLHKQHYHHLREEDGGTDSNHSTPEITRKVSFAPMLQAQDSPSRIGRTLSSLHGRVSFAENRETSSREEWARFVKQHQKERAKEKKEFQRNLPKATLHFLLKQARTGEMFVSSILLLLFISTYIASYYKKVVLANNELYKWVILGSILLWGFFINKFFMKKLIKLSKRFLFFETYVYYFIHSSHKSFAALIVASVMLPFWQSIVPNISNEDVIKYFNLSFVVIIMLSATNIVRCIGTKLLTGMANKSHFHEQIVNALFNERMLVQLMMPKKRSNAGAKKKMFSMKELFGDVELRKFHSMSRFVQKRSFAALGQELSTWDEINSAEKAQELAQKVFNNIDRTRKGYITKKDVANFVKPKYINKVFTIFDVDQDGKVSIEEVEDLVIRIYRERNALSNGLKDRENMGLVLTNIIKFVFWIVMFFISLRIYGFPIMDWITPLAAFFVGFGFIFGESLKEVFSSIVLIFVIHPYDVGDRVILSNDKSTLLIVASIHLLTTQFYTLEGKMVIMKNSTMAANQIQNLQRSRIASHLFDIQIEFGTPMEKIVDLRNSILAYLGDNPKTWKPELYFWISDLANSNRINIIFWCTTRFVWQEGPTNWQLKTELLFHIRGRMLDLGITYFSPPQCTFLRTAPEEREFLTHLLS